MSGIANMRDCGMALYFYNLPLGFSVDELKELVRGLDGVVSIGHWF